MPTLAEDTAGQLGRKELVGAYRDMGFIRGLACRARCNSSSLFTELGNTLGSQPCRAKPAESIQQNEYIRVEDTKLHRIIIDSLWRFSSAVHAPNQQINT